MGSLRVIGANAQSAHSTFKQQPFPRTPSLGLL